MTGGTWPEIKKARRRRDDIIGEETDFYLVMDPYERARVREALDTLMPAVDQAILRRELLPSRADPLRELLEALR